MMDLIAEMADYAIDRGFHDIFTDSMPDNPDDAIAFYEYSHGAPYGGIGVDIGAMRRNVQIRTRSASRAKAKQAADALYRLFKTKVDSPPISLASGAILSYPKQTPQKFETDAQGRVIFVFNLTIIMNSD